MSWFDIIVSLILLGAFIKGMQKGIVMQLAGFTAIIISAIFAGKIAKILLPFLLEKTNISTNFAGVICYILAFMIIVFGIRFIGKMLQSIFEAFQINFLNKIIGGIIGTAGAMILLSILINLAMILDTKEEVITSNLKTNSYLFSRVQVVVPAIVPYLDRNVWKKYIPDKYRHDDEKDDDENIPKELHS
ncbi:MAG: CvpA family protein [Candidatus Saccharimonadaceae bacterium]